MYNRIFLTFFIFVFVLHYKMTYFLFFYFLIFFYIYSQHIKGNIAVLAHTVLVGAAPTPELPLKGDEANLFHCAHVMAEIASKLIRPKRTNEEVTVAWEKTVAAFGVNMVEGTLSHQMKRY